MVEINMGDIIADAVGGRWDNPTGAYNIALKERLTAISEADTWAEAKKEWKATGNVWYIPLKETDIGVLPQHHANDHPHYCICGHIIAWHFEIQNTENNTLEIVGSDHIGFWMIVRHLIENKGIPEDMVTEERVREWITEAVKSMKAEWWWREHGEDFEERFNTVKELDLIINTRDGDNYYDNETERYENTLLIRKVGTGSFGEAGHKMASIVWRWNHPDNTRAQIITRGWPNPKLETELLIFHANLASHQRDFDLATEKRLERIAEVIENKRLADIERAKRDIERARQNEIRRERQRVIEEERVARRETALERTCKEWGIPQFTAEDSSNNDWEEGFLSQMIVKILNESFISTKQKSRTIKIVLGDKAPATPKQIKYIDSLGGDATDLSKIEASSLISELLEAKNNE